MADPILLEEPDIITSEVFEFFVDDGGIKRIRNACIRIKKPIYLVGSRASGTSTALSDFDYIIPNLKSKEWQKIKNSLPGARSLRDNSPNRIDLIKLEVDLSRPHIEVQP